MNRISTLVGINSVVNAFFGSHPASVARTGHAGPGTCSRPALQNALEKAFAGRMRFGALVGFAVTATPFVILGITPAIWALAAGLAASAIAERHELVAFWRDNRNQ